jgi:hypothetical protein
MKEVLLLFAVILLSGFLQAPLCAETTLGPEGVPRMTIEQLKAQLGNSDFIIIDVRTAHDWQDSSTKIRGAIREDSYKLGSWIDKYPKDKTIVLYCK